MKNILTKILLMFTLLYTNGYAESYFVETPSIVGDKSHLQKVVRELIIHNIVENGHEVSPSMTESKMTSGLLQLQSSYIMTLRSVLRGKTTSKKIKIKELDDLDVSIARLVKAVLNNNNTDQNINVKEITKNDETKLSRKIKVQKQIMLGFGPSAFPDHISEKSGINFLLGYA